MANEAIRSTLVESMKSAPKKMRINHGANTINNIVMLAAMLKLNMLYHLCLSIFLDRNGKKVRDITDIPVLLNITNFFPASNNPVCAGVQNIPNNITEKLLYKLGIKLLIKMLVLLLMACHISLNGTAFN